MSPVQNSHYVISSYYQHICDCSKPCVVIKDPSRTTIPALWPAMPVERGLLGGLLTCQLPKLFTLLWLGVLMFFTKNNDSKWSAASFTMEIIWFWYLRSRNSEVKLSLKFQIGVIWGDHISYANNWMGKKPLW